MKKFEWLMSEQPSTALRALHTSGWLAEHLPEVDALYGVEQRADHHPEVDTGWHIELSLDASAKDNASLPVRFAVLTHDLGKALTPVDLRPSHYAHEQAGLVPLKALCLRESIPSDIAKLAAVVCEYHLIAHQSLKMTPRSICRFFRESGLIEDRQLCLAFTQACKADARGRLTRESAKYPNAEFLQAAQALFEHNPYPLVPNDHPEWGKVQAKLITAVAALQAEFVNP